MIRVEKLTYEYIPETAARGAASDKVLALCGIDLEIEKGEFVSIIGHNGSGKTTLVKHFNALLLPTSGYVLIDGLKTNLKKNLWQIRQQVGMVFSQPDNQIVGATVEEDIAFGLENWGYPPMDIRHRVDETLQTLNLTHYKNSPPHFLPEGIKQKVAIAGVLVLKPDYLILDDVTSLLDKSGRNLVRNTLISLNKELKITIIQITHFMEETKGSDKIITMKEGMIERLQ